MKHTDILVINPGSTTTKIAVFRDMKVLFEETITHDPAKLKEMGDIFGQMDFREELIRETLRERRYDVKDLSATVGRGGMIVGLCGGGYKVTPELCQAMRNPDNPPHASSMGAELAYNIARPLGIPSFIYDSTMGCELTEVAKITGLEGIERYGCCHVLNSRAQAMKYALAQGKRYEELNLIVAHLGGGISVSAHQNGQHLRYWTDGAGEDRRHTSHTVDEAVLFRKVYGKSSGKTHKRPRRTGLLSGSNRLQRSRRHDRRRQ